MERTLIRVLVVEDFTPFREFICAALGQKPSLRIISEVSDGHEAVQRAEELKPDLILLDIGLPTLNGIEAAKRISTLVPDAMIIFVTQHNDADVVATALRNGAKAYVLKVDAYRELLPAVDAVLEGKKFISSGVTKRP
jgi:DNA-binding NarL/FixJ family response regulator